MKNCATKSKRILIVEDEAAVCEFCQRIRADEDFEVNVAAGDKVARAIIDERRYGLNLLNIKIPVLVKPFTPEKLKVTTRQALEVADK